MKACIIKLLSLVLFLLSLPAMVEAQYTYTVNSGGTSVTITGYSGSGGAVTIPSAINGLTVSGIGNGYTPVFINNLTSVTIPNTVTTLSYGAFYAMFNLTFACFQGNKPTEVGGTAFSGTFSLGNFYYVDGATGWGSTFDGLPTATCAQCGSSGPLYAVTVSASPANGGTVGGGGNFASGSSVTVTATANSGYTFANWTHNGTVVSTSSSYSLTVTSDEALVASFTTLESLESVVFNAPTAIGGGQPPTATVYLTGPAPAGGAVVNLTASTLWPSISVANPNVVSAPATVTVEPGQLSASFTVNTSTVNYPTYGMVVGNYGGILATGSVTVIAPPIPNFGSVADARVIAILQQFIALGTRSQAAFSTDFNEILLVRNQCPPEDNPPDHGRMAEQDIYLAAADHYLYAMQYPWAGLGVGIYNIIKLDRSQGGGPCNLPPSPPSMLSITWGSYGVTDSIRINVLGFPPIYPYNGN